MGCSLCNTIHPNARLRRGLYYSPAGHMYINADVNGSLNKDGSSLEGTSSRWLYGRALALKVGRMRIGE